MINQKSRTPKAEILLKNKKSRTLNAGVIYPSDVAVQLDQGVYELLVSQHVPRFFSLGFP